MRHLLPLAVLGFLGGCGTPAGTLPADPAAAAKSGGRCEPIQGTFLATHVRAFQDGRELTPPRGQEYSLFDLIRGCREPDSCKWSYVQTQAQPYAFQLTAAMGHGIEISAQDKRFKELWRWSLPADRLSCSEHGISVLLHEGLIPGGPGAWTVEGGKIRVELSTQSNGVLNARRMERTTGIFWFGLPYTQETGQWLKFSVANANPEDP